MGNTINVSFPQDDQELYEWAVEMAEDGPYANKSHLVRRALEELKDDGVSEHRV